MILFSTLFVFQQNQRLRCRKYWSQKSNLVTRKGSSESFAATQTDSDNWPLIVTYQMPVKWTLGSIADNGYFEPNYRFYYIAQTCKNGPFLPLEIKSH